MPQFLYIFLGSIPFFVGAATNFIGDLRDLAKTSKVGRSTFQFFVDQHHQEFVSENLGFHR
jgi:hypothetical protein